MKEQNDINSIRFPLINIRRTSNLAVAPINTFGLAIGLFMLAAPLMELMLMLNMILKLVKYKMLDLLIVKLV